jgi:hypothetical protein
MMNVVVFPFAFWIALAALLATAQSQCLLDSFDRARRNDEFETASNPYIGTHRAQTLCRNNVDRDDFHRFWSVLH